MNISAVNFLASNPATSYLVANGLKVTTEQVQMKKAMLPIVVNLMKIQYTNAIMNGNRG
ncbi:hypothetical protein OL548_15875 [Lysinibacillus sp. MHQ-1]|nr:hypothetical protein OL548_15875 [Lysinibacillus sp. MHQ-1]